MKALSCPLMFSIVFNYNTRLSVPGNKWDKLRQPNLIVNVAQRRTKFVGSVITTEFIITIMTSLKEVERSKFTCFFTSL